MYWTIIIGIVAMYVMTVVIRLVTKLWRKNCKNKTTSNISKSTTVLRIVGAVVSPDYLLADITKDKLSICNDETDIRGNYIKRFNLINLLVSAGLALIVYITMLLIRCCTASDAMNAWGRNILFGLIAFRTLSRTMEINISFVKDILESGEHKSKLSAKRRIGLAFTSLLEEVFLFVGVYSTMIDNWHQPLLGGLHGLTLGRFEACLCNGWDVMLQFVAVYQVICSIILITLSFANYISDNVKNKAMEAKQSDTTETELNDDGAKAE